MNWDATSGTGATVTVNSLRHTMRVGEPPAQCMSLGAGPPLILLHGDGENAADWQWVLSQLATTHSVYAPNLPGFDGDYKPNIEYTATFYARFIENFLDIRGIEQAAVVGNSLGGLAALHFALRAPQRVTALGLVDSIGLGRAIHPALPPLTLPGFGELGIEWAKTPLGAMQRAWFRARLLFAEISHVPSAWIAEQYRLAQTPGCLQTALAALRAVLDLGGQREVLLHQLPRLEMPTCIIWGEQDRIVPIRQAQEGVALLKHGSLVSIAECGHLPHVEQPDRFAIALSRFLNASSRAR